MVKITDLNKAAEINKRLEELNRILGLLEAGVGLGVVIQSVYQDDTMVTAVRPQVIKEMKRRRKVMHDELTALGVECPSDEAQNPAVPEV